MSHTSYASLHDFSGINKKKKINLSCECAKEKNKIYALKKLQEKF